MNSNLETKVNDLVYYLITQSQKKSIIKRADINKYVLIDKARNFEEIFNVAQNKLSQVFGFDVIYDEDKKGYLIVNQLSMKFVSINDSGNKFSLAFLIVSHIYNSGGTISENQIWKFIEKFGLFKGEEHEVFGDVDIYLNNMIKELYIDVFEDENEIKYKLGPRALQELIDENFTKYNAKLKT